MVPANVAHAARKPNVAYSERKKLDMEVRMEKIRRRGLELVAGSREVSSKVSDDGVKGGYVECGR